MYIIPENIDLSKFLLNPITEISYTLSTINIMFENYHYYIQLYGPFNIKTNNKYIECTEIYPIKCDFELIQLIGKMIVNVEVNSDRDILSFTFEDNILLNLISSEYYESFRIFMNKEEIVI